MSPIDLAAPLPAPRPHAAEILVVGAGVAGLTAARALRIGGLRARARGVGSSRADHELDARTSQTRARGLDPRYIPA